MPTSSESVSKLYGIISQHENSRLAGHPMEREITLRAIRKGLAATSPKRIADVGGGPGKLAFALADEGHKVDLIDLSPNLIQLGQAEQDKRKAAGNKPLLESIAVGNAMDKSALQDESYDAVLLLGPLYHLMEESERAQAVTHALNLAKPQDGLIFVAFISIAAHLRDIAMRNPGKILEFEGFYAKYLTDGRYEKFDSRIGTAVQSFHTRPVDIRSFFARNFSDSLDFIELRSTEGILGGGLDTTLAKSSDELVQAWASLLFDKYSTNEEHLGCADHLLAVLRRR
ncbi:hypothetical protein TOPH_07592 [Tolypocladium ophioglossoides CBS 100239]|uniref:Methyltransferase domain-containing protein n=1 Tax=Tolypocladium ophioglossoides (strain CBS 100239) TaxID=1163406 RepID=A0A0L0N1Q9_TOLOC|nr:hypothetical protein TOPH_07592 [Tolypocladium ophioglossoides CBS 100239]